ncbi:SAM-dependent methyltransferase [Streptomyces chartreusis]|uniref:SAM-dependent methyltransferase n=1 Tax=Streptomyces chartreusis TaxID=1969 RepID=UPI00369B08BD
MIRPSGGPPLRSGFDTSIPSSARIWNYWMGGKDNYEVDRSAGDEFLKTAPQISTMARQSRQYLIRAVSVVADEMGIHQFLDIGAGLPMYDNNTHEVAQRVAPGAKVVYVDNDPLVLVHAQALLRSSAPEGVTEFVQGDLHEPEKILDAAAETLDFTRPVALMLMGVLGHIQEYDEATSVVRRLKASLPSGSCLVHYDGVDTSSQLKEAQDGYGATGAVPYALRSPEQITAYYEGLDLIEPGVVSCPMWRPEPGASPVPTDVYGGIARKP